MTGLWYPPLEGYMSQPRGGASGPRASCCGGPSLGELSRGNWMAVVDSCAFTGALRSPAGRVLYLVKAVPTWFQTKFLPSFGGVVSRSAAWSGFGRPSGPACKIVTWLILPVVICLSQRLSHACLSISNHTVKLRMAH